MTYPAARRAVDWRRRAALISLATLAAFLAPGAHATAQGGAKRLLVFAASSLTEAFEELATTFEGLHPGVRVDLGFGGSATLATQLTQGAPAAVFASADVDRMAVVVEGGLAAGLPQAFAGNSLVVVTPVGSGVSTLADLAKPGMRLVLAGPEVPAGRYARAALHALDAALGESYSASVLANLVSEEPNVRQVAAKVELGEADAAIVYATDAAVLKAVRVLEFPATVDVRVVYPIVALKGAADPDLAAAFVELVLSPLGRRVLAAHGFAAP